MLTDLFIASPCSLVVLHNSTNKTQMLKSFLHKGKKCFVTPENNLFDAVFCFHWTTSVEASLLGRLIILMMCILFICDIYWISRGYLYLVTFIKDFFVVQWLVYHVGRVLHLNIIFVRLRFPKEAKVLIVEKKFRWSSDLKQQSFFVKAESTGDEASVFPDWAVT